MAKVLLVDDEITMVQMVGEVLRSEGHQVVPFTNSASAAEALSTVAPDLVMANLCVDRTRDAGLNVLQKARSLNPPAPLIAITPGGSSETALEAMKRGAYDYLNRPFTLDELKLRVQRALSYQAALCENVSLRKQFQSNSHFQDIVGASLQMQAVIQLIERVADGHCSILISGQSGTGKDLIARAIHFNSQRRLAPFVTVNCRLVAEAFLETELFGQRKATFTGAIEEEPGLLREADGGTILLDEVGFLSPALQTRLSTVLEERQIRRPSDDVPVRIDIRVLAAAGERLEEKVAKGIFNRELFQRLSEVSIELPALRERAEDIPLLISHFLQGKMHPRTGKPLMMSREAMDLCCAHHWPGNVRELKNALERAGVVCEDSVIQIADLPSSVCQFRAAPKQDRTPEHQNGFTDTAAIFAEPRHRMLDAMSVSRGFGISASQQELVPLKKFLRDQEVAYLQHALTQVGGSKERAAELLGISLATIYRKLSDSDSAAATL